MKKRLLSFVIALSMIICMLPAGAMTAFSLNSEEPVVFKTMSLTLDGSIGVNFFVQVNDEEALGDNAYMEMGFVGDETIKAYFSNAKFDESKEKYRFTFSVNALQMAQPVLAEFHYGEDKVISYVTSVEDYAMYLIDESGDDKTAELANALLTYGYYAQLALQETHKFTLGTADSVCDYVKMFDTFIVPDTNIDLSAYQLNVGGENDSITALSMSLALDNKTDIYLYVTTPSRPGVTGIGVMVDRVGQRFRITIPNIAANKLATTFSLNIDGLTVDVSAFSYIKSVLDSQTRSHNYKMAVAALYHYYVAAVAYASESNAETVNITSSFSNPYVVNYLEKAEEDYTADNRETLSYANIFSVKGIARNDLPNPIAATFESGTLRLVDRSNGAVIEKEISGGNMNLYNISPDGADYTVKRDGEIVQKGYIKPTDQVRFIYAPSVFNMRDLGGWECDGGNVKYGKVFRGSEIDDNISEEDKATFRDVLKIRAEVDFYHTSDRSILGDDVVYTPCATSVYYNNLVDLNGTGKDSIRKAVNAVIDNVKNGRPVYFHCQVGSDRAGTLAYILEAMLGISEKHLDMEYELTSSTFGQPGNNLRAGSRPRNNTDKYGTGYRAMISYFKQCTTNPSSIRDGVIAWAVLNGIDIDDINDFRQAMIDGEPEIVTAKINYDMK